MSGKTAAKAVNFASDLAQLQNLMKRDPESYKDEVKNMCAVLLVSINTW